MYDGKGFEASWENKDHKIKPPGMIQMMTYTFRLVDEPEVRPIDPEAVAMLRKSIEESGLLTPIILERANERGHRLIDGAHRLKAMESMGYRHFPALVFDPLTDEQRAYVREICNLDRKELSPEERAIHAGRKAAAWVALIGEKETPRKEVVRRSARKARSTTVGNRTIVDSDTQPMVGLREKLHEATGWGKDKCGASMRDVCERAGVEYRKSGKYPLDQIVPLVTAAIQVASEKPQKTPAKPRAPKVQPEPIPAAPEPASAPVEIQDRESFKADVAAFQAMMVRYGGTPNRFIWLVNDAGFSVDEVIHLLQKGVLPPEKH
jgi:hypothetical protein